MCRKSITELTAPEVLKINPEYELYVSDIFEIRAASSEKSGTFSDEIFEAIVLAFKYGYLQGTKAAKVERARAKKIIGAIESETTTEYSPDEKKRKIKNIVRIIKELEQDEN